MVYVQKVSIDQVYAHPLDDRISLYENKKMEHFILLK